jgi:hypothetical protein
MRNSAASIHRIYASTKFYGSTSDIYRSRWNLQGARIPFEFSFLIAYLRFYAMYLALRTDS